MTDVNFMEENYRIIFTQKLILFTQILISHPVRQLLKKKFEALLKLRDVHRNLLRFSTVLYDETLSLADKIPWPPKPSELTTEIFFFQNRQSTY